MVSLKDAIRLRVSRRATANLLFLLRRERPLLAGKPLHPSLSSSKRKIPNRNKTNSSIKPNTDFTPNSCASPVERLVKNEKFALKFASSDLFPQRLVMGSTTTATRKVVSSSTLIGPFKILARAQIQQPLALELKVKPVLWVVSHVT